MISNRIDANTVNGGGWTEVPVKHQTQMNANNEKRSVGKKAPVHKNRENSWKTEPEGNGTCLCSQIDIFNNVLNLDLIFSQT